MLIKQNMKSTVLVIAFIAVIGVGVVGTLSNNPTEVTKIDIESEPVEVPTVEENKLRLLDDEDAMKAAQAVIDRKHAEAELKSVTGQMEALDAKYKAEKAVLVEQETALEKKLNLY